MQTDPLQADRRALEWLIVKIYRSSIACRASDAPQRTGISITGLAWCVPGLRWLIVVVAAGCYVAGLGLIGARRLLAVLACLQGAEGCYGWLLGTVGSSASQKSESVVLLYR